MRGDFKLRTPIDDAFSVTWIVDAGTTSQAKAGEPVKMDDAAGSATGEVSILAPGEGTTAQRHAGICKNDSTETASAAGTVTTYLPLPGIIYSGKATTASNANTAALINAMIGKRVTFDLTSTTWSIDEDDTDAVANVVVILGGDPNTSTLFWSYRPSGTFLDFAISAS